MNLYLLTQSENTDYDTYDSCVVVAVTPAAARKIHPNGDNYDNRQEPGNKWNNTYPSGDWTSDPKKVTATLIGEAHKSLKENSVVIYSFNAG